MNEKDSILARYADPALEPAERKDPVRYERARVMAERILARIESEVKKVGVLRPEIDKDRVDELMDAFRWHVPEKVLQLTGLDVKIADLEEARTKVQHLPYGASVTKPNGEEIVIADKDDRRHIINMIDQDIDFLTMCRQYLLAGMSGLIRGWSMGKNDERMLMWLGTMSAVMMGIYQEGASFIRLKFYRVLPDGTEVPFEHPFFRDPGT